MEESIMENTVANELSNAGFKTRVFSDGIEVTLSNRKVNNMEVRTVLEQIFEDIEFSLSSIYNGILVAI